MLIIEDLLIFSTLMNKLWQALWPQARRGLSCRVKLNPPQSSLPIDNFEVTVSIKPRALQWKSPYIPIDLNNISNNTNSNHDESSDKAIKYLINRDDDTLKMLLESTLALNEPALKRLKKLSRTANLLNMFINEPSTSIAIDLVRNILSFTDTEDYWNAYINEVLNYIIDNFSQINLSEAMRMRNLAFKKTYKVKSLSQALEDYVKDEFTSWSEQDRYDLLIKIDTKENNWWYQSLKSGISKGINTLSIEWLDQAIELIVNKELSVLSHETILNNIEGELLERLLLKELDNKQLNLLKNFSNMERWPKIYAWCVYKLEEPTLTFAEVLAFQNNNIVGFRYLFKLYGAKDSLIVFRRFDDSRILKYLVSTHGLIEDLLQYLELEEAMDKHILSIGYSSGISILQKTVSNTELDKILHSASNGEKVYGLIASIADSEFKFNLAERTLYKLKKGFEWKRLTNSDSNALLDVLSHYSQVHIKTL